MGSAKVQTLIRKLNIISLLAIHLACFYTSNLFADDDIKLDDKPFSQADGRVIFLQNSDEPRYLADVQVGSTKDLLQVLERIDNSLLKGELEFDRAAPIVFLLHGNEARSLFKQNYVKNKELVDLAARLSAFNVADIRVCETWMDGQRLDKNDLQPFIRTIPSAPVEKKKLIKKEGFIYF